MTEQIWFVDGPQGGGCESLDMKTPPDEIEGFVGGRYVRVSNPEYWLYEWRPELAIPTSEIRRAVEYNRANHRGSGGCWNGLWGKSGTDMASLLLQCADVIDLLSAPRSDE